MALAIVKESSHGIDAGYWKIVDLDVQLIHNRIIAMVGGYTDKDHADTNSTPFDPQRVTAPLDGIDLNGDLRAQVYEYIMNMPQKTREVQKYDEDGPVLDEDENPVFDTVVVASPFFHSATAC